jgi:hypothetical protein
LGKLLSENKIDVVALQETHTDNEEQLTRRGKIPGYDLAGATFHRAYGVATYVRSDIENAYIHSVSDNHNIHNVTIKLGENIISNIYKPPSCSWPTGTLPVNAHPATYVGDFNSHHTQWKYRKNNEDGERLVNWAEDHNMHLVFDAKDRGSFRSAAWKRDSNPDLCFVSSENNKWVPCTRKILSDFPHSQHRPAIIAIGIKIPLITSFPRPRWNFQKANWSAFSRDLDRCLGWIPPKGENYSRFVGAVISTAKKYIPRGFRKQYIPGWSRRSEDLYKDFNQSGDREIADELVASLDAARRQKWMETMETLDFKTSSRKAWSLLRKLSDGGKIGDSNQPISPNRVANHIAQTSKAPSDKAHTRMVKNGLKSLRKSFVNDHAVSNCFTADDITKAIKELKNGKAPGFDGIHPEFLIHCGKYATKWMTTFFSDILSTGNIPDKMKRAKIIAILKPGKPPDQPKSYRPIALLSVIFKLLERLIYNRISPQILNAIPIEQAGFRPNRSCSDQILALTTFVESGFEKNLKTHAAFIYLSAAYDTVWRQGLIYKLAQIIPSQQLISLVSHMLTGRTYQVIIGKEKSGVKKLNNGLPQGSVLAPLLFNLYISDLPETTSRKFGYADDWTLAFQHRRFDVGESTLTSDLEGLGQYFRKWRLLPNASKTEVTCFHLNNREANTELSVSFEGEVLNHSKFPKYLGVTLDRTLTYKEHLNKLSSKVKTRNNVIQKLTGTTWGSTAETLRISALSLVYSAAEYASPVWLNSSHTSLVDVQLNNTQRIISGTLRSTPTHWLPVLSHIQPQDLRRQNALIREYRKLIECPALPANQDLGYLLTTSRLKSRKPPLVTGKGLYDHNFSSVESWRVRWEEASGQANRGLPCITDTPPGFNLPRRHWTALNRIRTGHGRCADFFFKCGWLDSPECDCGAERQTVHHIVSECSLTAYDGDSQDFIYLNERAIDYLSKGNLNF